MAFIETPAESELYEADLEQQGYVANMTRVFAHRPELWAAWRGLVTAIRGSMDWRRYELVTLAAARELRSSYCMLAHGSILAKRFMAPEDVRAVATDPDNAGLDALDLAVMDLAEKVADDATAVTQEDIDGLRALGLPDAEILGVVLAAAARCFFSKTLDGLGALPDHTYDAMEPALRDALTVGRPIAPA
jgi:uncharacterized peroxidase-related enzyme